MHNERVSIIMPAYNVSRYMTESISSVIAQTYRNWELIVVDDGSTDDTANVVKRFAANDSRIKYFWQENGRQGRARNLGIKQASGQYIALLDADDLWHSSKLEIQLETIKATSADVVFGNAFIIKQNKFTDEQTGSGYGTYKGASALEFLLSPGMLVVSSVFLKLSAVREVHGFATDDRIQYCEDWHFWLKLALTGKVFQFNDRVLCYYRLHPESAAQIEQNAQLKFYYALLDLHQKFPNDKLVCDCVFKRAAGIVFNEPQLNKDIVSSIAEFMKHSSLGLVPVSFHRLLFSLNVRLYRKIFPFMVRNRRA